MEHVKLSDYVFAQAQNRERVAVNRYIADPGSLLGREFGDPFGWPLPYVWLGLRLPHERLLRGFSRPAKRFQGDVDVMGAGLQPCSAQEYERYLGAAREDEVSFQATLPEKERYERPEQLHHYASAGMVEEGKIKWPVELDYIAATEVKAAYYSASDDLKATGSKDNGRHQAEELCLMGFDRVGLVRFVVTEPVNAGPLNPWFLAASRGAVAIDEYLDDPTKGIRVEEEDPFGTILLSCAAVPEKLEDMAGSISGAWLSPPRENPHREEAIDVRRAIQDNLAEIMSRYQVPRSVPVLILACSNDKCACVYVASNPNPDELCPSCGQKPR